MPSVRYQPIGPLNAGEGSRAVLGLALEDGAAPRPVVLVWAPPELTQDPEQAARLARETQRATVFEHPNILRVHGLVELEGGLARVTEYADGESLRAVLETGKKLGPGFATMVVADAAMGVHYAHLAGNDDGTPLIHGDLRPETMMVSFGGVCRVTGYGALGVAPKESDGRRVRNRRRYSAPEQLLGGRDANNVQTDVFLLGLVLYECLTGKIPFKDTPDPDKATLTRPLPPMPADVSRQMEAVVRKATAKRANERYPTVLAFREALLEAAGPLPSRELFASHLSRLFPPEGDVRKARRQVLEKGLEDARKAGGSVPVAVASVSAAPPPEKAAPVPVAAGSVSASGTPVPAASTAGASASGTAVPVDAASPAGAEPQQPAPPAAAPSRTEPSRPSAPPQTHYEPPLSDETPLPQRPRWLVPFAVGGLVLALAAGAFLHQSRQSPAAAAPEDAGVVLAAAESVDAGALDAGAVAAVDAGTPADGGALALLNRAAPTSPEALLELLVEPQVDVSIDGRVLGRTPLNVSLPPGKYVLYLNNPALGIQTARAVTLSLTERNLHQIQLLRGFIHVRAPSGAVVVLDGRNVGKAPIEQLDAYEGPHRLLVTLDGQNWEQSFQLTGAQHVTFTVKFNEEP